jgi:hypothetical protein
MIYISYTPHDEQELDTIPFISRLVIAAGHFSYGSFYVTKELRM